MRAAPRRRRGALRERWSRAAIESSDRFVIERSLGEGAFGVVYEAFDRRREQRIALKHLREVDPRTLLRFKGEFRALADISHRNLVQFMELVTVDDEWYLTMELIQGQHLLRYVREERIRAHSAGVGPDSLAGRSPSGSTLAAVDPDSVTTASFRLRFDEPRLRDVFGQLAEGVHALHAHDMLHRDLKPSNVLVTREGRVVILDFGLVANLGLEHLSRSTKLVGTPAYMSPEQTAEEALSSASDWYSVGVMLYEALTGQLPFAGTIYQIIARRAISDPRPPREVADGIPDELDALCQALLSRDPEARPGGEEILRRLVHRPVEVHVSLPAPRDRVFVGRESQLAILGEALANVRRGHAATVYVKGPSGMGKTALVRRFLDGLDSEDEPALVLAGRCYQRESVPYKAIDSLVDSLSRYLDDLPQFEAARLLPPDWPALARLFPVLRGIGEEISGRIDSLMIPDAQELRRRGFGALKEILTRLGGELTVALFIDDLQWGDIDSGRLLRELMRPPNPPPLLLVVCYRSDDTEGSPLLRMLEEVEESGSLRWDVEIGELSPEEAHELALFRLGGDGPAAQAQAAALARESGGSPFFVDELARHKRTFGQGPTAMIRLESVIEARLAEVPAGPRRLLDVIAVAGRPVDLAVANQAAGFDPKERTAIELLRTEQWVRRRAVAEGDVFETFHDRLRVVVVSQVPEDLLPSYHNRLATALEAAGVADAETLAEHYARSGDHELAARHTLRAAHQAAEALAFDRAARLYRMGLDLWEPDRAEGRELLVLLAETLVNAGRGAEAARTYLRAAEDAPPDRVLELTRPAAEQFLISGLIEEGLAVLRRVLAMVHMKLAGSPRRALVLLILRRLQLRLRGLRFRPRRPSEIPAYALTKIDVCWSVAVGLGMVDVTRGAHFQTTNLVLALRAGEPSRVARALLIELAFSSAGGGRSLRRTDALHERCRSLVEQVDQPYLTGLFGVVEAIVANSTGDFPKCYEAALRGGILLRERCTAVTWEVDTAHLYELHALASTGRWKELAARVPVLLEDGLERGDQYITSYIRSRTAFLVYLAEDDVDKARDEQERSLEGWTREGFQLQHYWDWYTRGEIDLYAGDPHAAWKRLTEGWRRYRHSLLPRVQGIQIEISFLRARVAIAMAAGHTSRQAARFLDRAEKDVRGLEAERMPWSLALAELASACVSHARGDEGGARQHLERARDGLDRQGLGHLSSTAGWRLGQLVGGDEGDDLVQEARSRLEIQGVRHPERIVDIFAPGRWS